MMGTAGIFDRNSPNQPRISLRAWFLIACLLGALGIGIQVYVDRSSAEAEATILQIIGLLVCVAVMATYIFVGLRRGASETGLLQFADSIYYLGFLFTLIALAASLLDFRGESPDAGEIAARFGIALITTLIGLGARVFITNFQSTLDDEYERAEQSIEEAFRSFRDHLEQMNVDLVAQNELMRETLKRAADETTRQMSQLGADIRKRMEQTTIELAESLKGSSATFQTTLTSAAASFEKETKESISSISSNLGMAIGQLETDLTRLRKSLEEVTLPQDILVRTLGPPLAGLSDTLQEVRNQLAGLAVAEGDLRNRFDSIDGSFQAVDAATASAASSVAQLGDGLQGLSGTFEKFQEFSIAVSRFGESVNDQIQNAQNSVDATVSISRNHQERLSQSAAEAENALVAVTDELRRAVSHLRTQMP